MSACTVCQTNFVITAEDQQFYAKIAVPAPTLCPDCRLKRRLAFRNENHLYQRTCDLCHKAMIAAYPANSPFPVYCVDCWWSDRWDPLSYGRDIDWSRPFFDQFAELFAVVPKANLLQFQNENSPYNAYLAFGKNSYMSAGSYLIENCCYVRKSQDCKDSVNSMTLNKCELVADSINCDNCYSSHHLLNCRSCAFSSYLQDCSGIQYGFMCCGVKNLKYCFKNKTYSEADYQTILKTYAGKSPAELQSEFKQFCSTVTKPDKIQINCDGCTGDYLFNCHNALESYDCFDVDTGKYLLECAGIKDSMDLTMHDKGIELCYEMCSGGEKNYLSKFGFCVVASPETEYAMSCFYLSNGFGCAQIHSRAQYCILNKQYSKEEYEQLRSRLIAHMHDTKEYGEFFPTSLSPFTLEETVVPDYFPVTPVNPTKPEPVAGAKSCTNCGKAFKVINQEKALYQHIGVSEPELCMQCRFLELRSWKKSRTH
jgi:hypothetical protein